MQIIDHFKSVPGDQDPKYHQNDEEFLHTAKILREADPRLEFVNLYYRDELAQIGTSINHVLQAQFGSERGAVAILTNHPWSYIRYYNALFGIFAYMQLAMVIIHVLPDGKTFHAARISRTAFWRVPWDDVPKDIKDIPKGKQFFEDPISTIEVSGPHSLLMTLKCGTRLHLSLKEHPSRGLISTAYLTWQQFPIPFTRKSSLRVKRYRWPRWPRENDFWHYLARLVENPIVHMRQMRGIDYVRDLARNPYKRAPLSKKEARPKIILPDAEDQ